MNTAKRYFQITITLNYNLEQKDYTVNNNINIGENNEPLQSVYSNVMFYACKDEDNIRL